MQSKTVAGIPLRRRIGIPSGFFSSSRTLHIAVTKKKKTFKAAEAYTESKQLQRYEYWNIIKDIKVEDLVFLDETGVNLAMVSFYGRAIKGKSAPPAPRFPRRKAGARRAYDLSPQKRGKNVSIIGTMTLNHGFLTGFSFEGGTNGDTFLWFVENVLAPYNIRFWCGDCA